MSANNFKKLSKDEIVTIMHSMQDTYYRTDSSGELVLLSPSVEQLLGYAPEEMFGTRLADYYLDEEGRNKFIQTINAQKGVVTDYQAALKHKNGNVVWVSTNAHYYYGEQGELLGVEGTTRNITPQKLAEDRSQNLQRQLWQSQKMEAIGQLAGGIAHDFNNMLTSIMGYASLGKSLQGNDSSDKTERYFKEIYQAGQRATELIGQILAFSRGMPTEHIDLDLKQLLHETMRMLRAAMPASVMFECHISSEPCIVSGASVQLQQVIMNLCINAADAMQGSGTLKIDVRPQNFKQAQCVSCCESVDEDYIVIAVRDTGCGMAEGVAARIFDPFFSTKDVGQGTGMGLSMAHGIVHEHGGHIMLHSTVGEGSEFQVLLPKSKSSMSKAATDKIFKELS